MSAIRGSEVVPSLEPQGLSFRKAASARFCGLVFQFVLNCLCVYFRQESW